MMWPPDGIPSSAPCPPPTLGAWDCKLAAHRRGAAPQQPAGTTAQAAKAFCWAIEQMDDNDDGPQTTDGQVVALVAAADTHPEHRSTTPLQRCIMPIPSCSWKPPSMTIPGLLSRWTTMTPNPAKLPGGQAVALVVVVDTEQGGQESSGQAPWTRLGPVRPQDEGRGIR
jgi:hypothetical protein